MNAQHTVDFDFPFARAITQNYTTLSAQLLPDPADSAPPVNNTQVPLQLPQILSRTLIPSCSPFLLPREPSTQTTIVLPQFLPYFFPLIGRGIRLRRR